MMQIRLIDQQIRDSGDQWAVSNDVQVPPQCNFSHKRRVVSNWKSYCLFFACFVCHLPTADRLCIRIHLLTIAEANIVTISYLRYLNLGTKIQIILHSMAELSNSDERLYFISSCSNLCEVRANRRTATSLISTFCTVTATKDYHDSSLIKVENHLISEDLLLKLLKRTLSDEISLTQEEQKVLQPYSSKLKIL